MPHEPAATNSRSGARGECLDRLPVTRYGSWVDESQWLRTVPSRGGQLPEGARVVVAQAATPSSPRGPRAVTQLAAALARSRARVLLMDLGANGYELASRFASADAAGLRDVLVGRARPVDVAVPVRELDFIYFPPGGSRDGGNQGPRTTGTSDALASDADSDAGDAATHRRLRELLAKARRAGATVLLYGASDPRILSDVADGIVWLDPARRTATESGSLPVLMRSGPPAPDRGVASRGHGGRSERVARSRSGRRRHVHARRKGGRPVRHRAARGVASGSLWTSPPPLAVLTLALACLVSFMALSLALWDESGPDGLRRDGTPSSEVLVPSWGDPLLRGDLVSSEAGAAADADGAGGAGNVDSIRDRGSP